ncbi:MAG: type III pantothenate kinase [Oscillospiraceae bacterium]|nr:type III pantothenate kinase [Oscillospiraceae bacterium]MDD4413812.1 type III pantothenate kinase [Oscillospiraceae bacterium]
MLLALDMGNTNITVGMFKGERLMLKSRIATDRAKMEDQYAVELLDILRLYGLDSKDFNGAIICSVVPPLNTVIKHAVEKVTGVVPMMVIPGTKTGVNIRIDNPAQLGSDLLVGAVAAVSQYGAPCIIWDLGTATTVSVVDRDGVFRGGAIMAGVGVAIESLVSRASQLPRISLETPEKVIGVNTIESMQSGVVYGAASMIDGMCDRIEDELGYCATTVLTGGLGKEIALNCRHKVIYDDDLVLTGLHIIFQKNKK